MSTKETWDIKDISEATHELVKKAARHDKQTIHDWVEAALRDAAEQSLEPGKIVTEPEKLGAMIKSIDRRLASIEHGPLQHSARLMTEGAKAIGESARDIYERVEARKWFDKSYETAAKACDTLGQHFKTWWESRGGSTTASSFTESTENKAGTETVVETVVVEEVKTHSKKTKEE
jgi:hypothetical protein